MHRTLLATLVAPKNRIVKIDRIPSGRNRTEVAVQTASLLNEMQRLRRFRHAHSPENRGMPFRRAKGHIECPRFEIAVRELVTLRIMAGNASFSTLEPHVTHRTPTDIHIDVRAVMAAEDYSCRSDLGKNSAGQPVKIIPSLLRCVK
jgi:hypothetical protein